MKRFLLFLLFCTSVSCTQQETQERTRFFPKLEHKATRIPKKSKLWVFILAGQSNMAGRGFVEPQDTIPSNRIFTINKKGKIIYAKEPFNFYEPSMTGLDCSLSFGKELIKQIPDSISILIIQTAVGGSSISQWLGDLTRKGVKLFTNFKGKIKIGKKYGQIKGILWHQGESDANPKNLPFYKERLAKLFFKFREYVVGNKNLPTKIFIETESLALKVHSFN